MTSFLNIHLTADANFAPVYAELSKLKTAMNNLSSATAGQIVPAGMIQGLKTAEAKMLGLAQATKAFNVQTLELASATDRLSRNIAQSKLRMGEYFSIISKSKKGIVGELDAIAAAQARITQATYVPGITRGTAHMIAATKDLGDSLQKAQIYQQLLNNAYRDGAEKLINFGKNTQWAGRQLTAGLTVPMMLAGKTAAKMFQDVNIEITRLQKVYGVGITQATQGQLDAIRKDIMGVAKELSTTLGVSAKETTSMAADLAAAGLTGKDLINATRQAARMTVLGEADKQDAIKATISLQTAFKLNTNELTDSVNFFNAAQAATSTNMADLIGAIPRVGPVVKGLGGDYKDMVALLVAMKEGGVAAGEGANALKNSLARIINPTQKAKDTLKGYGIDMDTIVNKNAGNLIGTITELQAGLDRLPSLQRQRAISEMFGKYQFARMTALFNNFNREGSQSAKVMDMMSMSSAQLAGIADEQTKQIQQSASGRYKIAMESFKTAVLPIGESFLTFAAKILNVVTKIVEGFNKLGPLATVLKGALGFATLVGPVTMFVGLIANLGGQLFKIFNVLRMFKQGFTATPSSGGMLARFKGGIAGTKEYYKEADPALLASERLSKTVTEQVMKEEDAIRVLSEAIREYAMEVERLQQIYAGGTITPPPAPGTPPGAAGTPTPTPGGTPGAGPSARTIGGAYPTMKMTGGERVGQTWLHSGSGKAALGEEARIAGLGFIRLQQGRAEATHEKEIEWNQAWGSTPSPMLTASQMSGMSDEQLRAMILSNPNIANNPNRRSILSGFSREQLESSLGETRDIASVSTETQYTEIGKRLKARGVKFKASASLGELRDLIGKEESAKIKLEIQEKIKIAREKAMAEVAHIDDEVERATAYNESLTKKFNAIRKEVVEDISVFETKAKGKAWQKTQTFDADAEKAHEEARGKALSAARQSGLQPSAYDEALEIEGGLSPSPSQSQSSAAKARRERIAELKASIAAKKARRDRIAELKARRDARMSGTAAKSGFGEWFAEHGNFGTQSDYEAVFSEENMKKAYPTKGQKIKGKMSSGIQRAIAGGKNVFGGKLGGATGFAVGTGLSMLSGMLPGSDKSFEEQNAGMQAMSGLSKGMQIGGAIGQFLPPPYNMIATGAGAIVGAVGGLLLGGIAHAKMLARQEAAAVAGAISVSTSALEHFGIKVKDFGDAAFTAATAVTKLAQSEIDSLAAKYKAQQENDSAFNDEIEGIKKMSKERQKALMQEKFLTDIASGMTAGQAQIDIAAYMKNAGISSGMGGLLRSLQSQGVGLTSEAAFAQGLKGAKSSALGDQTGNFLFTMVTTAQNLDTITNNFKALSDQAALTSETFNQYNNSVAKQNSELAAANEQAMAMNVSLYGLKSGTAGYQDAVERVISANQLFAQGVIQTVQQLKQATTSAASLAQFAAAGTVESGATDIAAWISGNPKAQTAANTSATNTANKAKTALQNQIDAQKEVIDGIQKQISGNNTLRQQAQEAANTARETQSAQHQLDQAMASGNLLRISAAQANLEETKSRIANSEHFNTVQEKLEARMQTQQGKLNQLTSKMNGLSTSANKAATATSDAFAATADGAATAQENINAVRDDMLKWVAAGKQIDEGFWNHLNGKDAKSPAGRAWAALKNGVSDVTTLQNKLKKFAGTKEFKTMAADVQQFGDQILRVQGLLGLAGAASMASSFKGFISPATSKITQAGQDKNKTILAQALSSGANAEQITAILQSQGVKTAAAFQSAFGIKKTGNISSIVQSLMKERAREYYFGKIDPKTKIDPNGLSGGIINAIMMGDIAKTQYTVSNDGKVIVKAPPKFKSNAAAKKYDGIRVPVPGDEQDYWQMDTYANMTKRFPEIVNFKSDKPEEHWFQYDGSEGATMPKGSQTKFGWAMQQSNDINAFAKGGYVSGPGGPTTDSIRALLSNGEYVIKADSVRKYGIATLDALNSQRLAGGGIVGTADGDSFESGVRSKTMFPPILSQIWWSKLAKNLYSKYSPESWWNKVIKFILPFFDANWWKNVGSVSNVKGLDLGKAFTFTGKINSKVIDLGNTYNFEGDINSETVDLGNTYNFQGDINAQTVDLGNTYNFEGNINAKTVDLGNTYTFNGNINSQSVNLGNTYSFTGAINSQRVDLGNTYNFTGAVNSKSLDLGNTYNFTGAINSKSVDLGNTYNFTGAINNKSIDLGSAFNFTGTVGTREINLANALTFTGTTSACAIKLSNVLNLTGNATVDAATVINVSGKLTKASTDVFGITKSSTKATDWFEWTKVPSIKVEGLKGGDPVPVMGVVSTTSMPSGLNKNQLDNAMSYVVSNMISWASTKAATGGFITGPGTSTSDSIPTMLSNGEYVISAAAVKRVGTKYLDLVNNGIVSRGAGFAAGGLVGSVNSVNPMYNININVEGTNSSPEDIANVVLRAIERRQSTLTTNRRVF